MRLGPPSRSLENEKMHENRLIKILGILGILLFVTHCGMVPSGGDSSGSEQSLSTGQPNPNVTATLVLGQVNFVNRRANAGALSGSPGAKGLDRPFGVAIDRSVIPNRVYVADYGNNRVLGWASVDSLYNGVAADRVFGQSDFTSRFCNRGHGLADSGTLCYVRGLEVDGAGNLYVADIGNSRVLIYMTPYVKTAVAGSGDSLADRVIGQNSLTSRGCSNPSYAYASETALCLPYGVTVDAIGNVYVADSGNNRVVEYDTPLTTDMVADRVFGQPDFLSFSPGTGTGGLDGPVDMAVDSQGNLYVADQGNHRILEYDTPLVKDWLADRVIGQKNFKGSFVNQTGLFNKTDAKSLSYPEGVEVDVYGNLYSAESGNSRLLEFKDPLTTDAVGDLVYGQPDFSSLGCNSEGGGKANNKTLCAPFSVAIDSSGNVWAADYGNNRVIRFGNLGGPPINPPLLPPSNLASTAGDGFVTLTWTPSGSATTDQQRLYRGTSSGGPYTLIATFNDNTTDSYTDSGVTNGTTYYYALTASSTVDDDVSDYSNETNATPGAPSTPPSEVTIPSESFHFEEYPGKKCPIQNEVEFSFEKIPGDRTSGDAGHTINDIVESTAIVTMIFPDGFAAQGKFVAREDHDTYIDLPYSYATEYKVKFDCYAMKSHVTIGDEVTIDASGTLTDGHTFLGTGMIMTHR